MTAPDWWIYRGTGRPLLDARLADVLPAPPSWRTFDGGPLQPFPPLEEKENQRRLGVVGHAVARVPGRAEVDMVNAALLLRRPILVTGRPGTGKSSLAYRISRELRLGRVLRWSVTSRTMLRAGLYDYDAIGRAQASVAGHQAIGDFVQLGPLGTALLPYELPRVLLIDELDKSDIDLPNDLLHVFEDGEFSVPELVRVKSRTPEVTVFTDDPDRTAVVVDGRIRCRAFPVVVITSNGERQFPPAFLRRCLHLEMPAPDHNELATMVAAHFVEPTEPAHSEPAQTELIRAFVARSQERGGLATDQLLNAVFLATSGAYAADSRWPQLLDAIWHELSVGRE
jgi:MoxR-like ATPase